MASKLWIGRFGAGAWALYDPEQQSAGSEYVNLYLIQGSGNEPPRWAVFSKDAARKALSAAPPSEKRTALLAEYANGVREELRKATEQAQREAEEQHHCGTPQDSYDERDEHKDEEFEAQQIREEGSDRAFQEAASRSGGWFYGDD